MIKLFSFFLMLSDILKNMKHQKALFVSVVALGLSAIVIAINPSIRISASYNSELTWWENDCQLPDGYTSISSIVDS